MLLCSPAPGWRRGLISWSARSRHCWGSSERSAPCPLLPPMGRSPKSWPLPGPCRVLPAPAPLRWQQELRRHLAALRSRGGRSLARPRLFALILACPQGRGCVEQDGLFGEGFGLHDLVFKCKYLALFTLEKMGQGNVPGTHNKHPEGLPLLQERISQPRPQETLLPEPTSLSPGHVALQAGLLSAALSPGHKQT